MSTVPNINPRTIRITKPCEFGDPGDHIRPEPYDVAALLVEVRGVAAYEQETAEVSSIDRSTPASNESTRRRGRRRRGRQVRKASP